jgi:putative nucleotidyltransferase with HDIG domain
MRFKKAFLQSKVAQRIVLLFFLCALLPIALLAALSFKQVTGHLHELSQMRLQQTSKSFTMAIYERLLFLEAELIRIKSSIHKSSQDLFIQQSSKFNDYLENKFKGLIALTADGECVPIICRVSVIPEFSWEEEQHILDGKTLLTTRCYPKDLSHIYLAIAIKPNSSTKNILLAEIEPSYLWFMGYTNPLPPMTELLVLDKDKNFLFSSLHYDFTLPAQAIQEISKSSSGRFEWVYDGVRYLCNYRDIFLQAKFRSSHWIVILSEPKTHIYAPLAFFKKTFPLAILLSLWVVLYLSISQIRRSLGPLEKLKEGAQRIAKGKFETKVTVATKDEFADVATTFNAMAFQLGRQFKTLTTIAEIDRAILSSFDSAQIVNTLLNRWHDVFPCKAVNITLFDSKKQDRGISFLRGNSSDHQKVVRNVRLSQENRQILHDNPESLIIESPDPVPAYLAPLSSDGIITFIVFPIFLKHKLAGIISLGYGKKPDFTKEDFNHARQLSDQVGVALSNAQLIEELSDFNLGTLTALARAIDAKSHWTAGHSERVTRYALEIGQEMGLSDTELDLLRRGGLVHDIGKLGIPNKIINKSERLTKREKQIMQEHPLLGARILEPIAAYTDITQIVLQHHENYDGTGYPQGLAGEEISLYSRIFAVADSFEAMTSNRPYREAVHQSKALEIIKKEAGTQFDPKVVDAFIKVRKKTNRSRRTRKKKEQQKTLNRGP